MGNRPGRHHNDDLSEESASVISDSDDFYRQKIHIGNRPRYHNDDDLSEESASVMSDSDNFFRQHRHKFIRWVQNAFRRDVPDDASTFSFERYLTRHEFIHWIRNEEDPISILLSGTRQKNSPLSMLQGLEDSVFENIATFAVSPCNCCRDGPVAFCCRQQKKCVIDKSKKPRPVSKEGGEVPDEIFLDHNVLMYEEGLPGGTYAAGARSPGGASSLAEGFVFHNTLLVVTDTGFSYDYYDGIDMDYDNDNDIDYRKFKFWFEWSKSTRVLITSKKFPDCLTVELITDMFEGSEHPAFSWRRRNIHLPAARIQEISHFIQEKRRAVLDSSEYKEMVDYISRQNTFGFRREHYD